MGQRARIPCNPAKSPIPMCHRKYVYDPANHPPTRRALSNAAAEADSGPKSGPWEDKRIARARSQAESTARAKEARGGVGAVTGLVLQTYEATKAALVEAQLSLIADGCRSFVRCWKDMVQVDPSRTQNPSRIQAITVCATQDLITKAQYGAMRPTSQHYAIDVRVASILTRLFHSAPRGKTVQNPSLAGLFRAYTAGFASARDGDGSAPSRCVMTELQSALWHCIVLCSIRRIW